MGLLNRIKESLRVDIQKGRNLVNRTSNTARNDIRSTISSVARQMPAIRQNLQRSVPTISNIRRQIQPIQRTYAQPVRPTYTPPKQPSQFTQGLRSFAPIISPLFLLNKNVRNQQSQNLNQVSNPVGNFMQNNKSYNIPEVPQLKGKMNTLPNRATRWGVNMGIGLTNSIVSQGIINPINDIAQQGVNVATGGNIDRSQLKSGAFKFGYDATQGRGKTSGLQLATDLGQTVVPIVNAWGGGKIPSLIEKGVANASAKETLIYAIKQSGKIGAKVGALAGGVNALGNEGDTNWGQKAKDVAVNTVIGGVGGGIIGGALPVAGAAERFAVNKVKSLTPFGKIANLMDVPVQLWADNPRAIGNGQYQKTPIEPVEKTYSTFDFEKIVGKGKNLVRQLNIHDGEVKAKFDPQSGEMLSWSSNNPLFNKYFQRKALGFGGTRLPAGASTQDINLPEGSGQPKPGEVVSNGEIETPKPSAGLEDIKYSTSQKQEPFKTRATDFVEKVRENFANRYRPIEQLVQGKKLSPSENPNVLLKRFSGGLGIANEKIDSQLTPIINQTQDFDGLRKFLISERMNELSGRGIGQDANKALLELKAKVGDQEFNNFGKIAGELYDYQKSFLTELKNSGVLSQKQLDNILSKNQKYVPFQRVMDDLERQGFITSSKNVNVQSSGIKTIKGSEREIIDPIESMIKNTYDLTSTVEKQRVLNALVKVGEFEKIKMPNVPVATKDGVSIFRPSKFEPKEPHLTLFEDGKKVYYKTTKEIADAVSGMHEEQLNLALRAMALPAKLLRTGATGLNVGFAVPNVVRDQLSAAVNSKYGGIPIYDFLSGLTSLVRKDDAYKKWILSGADQSAFFSQERTTLQRTVGEVTKNKVSLMGKLVKNPLELLRAFGEYSEKGTRIGVFKRAFKGAGKKGLTGFDQTLDAMEQSREATIDFARRGSKMKAANSLIPFLNARMQGSIKLMQSFKERPVQSLAIGGSLVTIPTIALYFHNKQDPMYDEIPDYIKQSNFIIMTGNDKVPFIKVPKGEIGQIFGNPTENLLAYLYNTDKQSFFDLSLGIINQLSPVSSPGDLIPTAAKVPMELLANYDTFRKQNIVSPYQKDLPPELQFNNKTSETAKLIGEKLRLSPAKIEHTIKGLTAGLGTQALQASDAALFGKLPDTASMPVVDRFMGEPKDLSKTANEIYDKEEKRKQETARNNYAIKQRINKAIDTNDTQMLLEAQKANPDAFKGFVQGVLDDRATKDMTPQEKAIRSLPKKEQEKYNLAPLSTTQPISLVGGASAATGGDANFEDLLQQIVSGTGKDPKSDLNNAKLTQYKNNGDVDNWIKTADSQISNLKSQLGGAENETERIKIENKIHSLQDQRDKFNSYNGFTKPKKGKAGKKYSLTKIGNVNIKTSTKKYSMKIKVSRPKAVKIKAAKIRTYKLKLAQPKKLSKIRSY